MQLLFCFNTLCKHLRFELLRFHINRKGQLFFGTTLPDPASQSIHHHNKQPFRKLFDDVKSIFCTIYEDYCECDFKFVTRYVCLVNLTYFVLGHWKVNPEIDSNSVPPCLSKKANLPQKIERTG